MLKKLLNDKEFDNFIISKNHALVNKTKDDYIEKNAEIRINDKEHEYYIMNNSKYHLIAKTKPSSLLAKFIVNHDKDRFCLICLCNFQTNKQHNEH